MQLLIEVFKIDENLLLYLPFLLDKIDEVSIKNWLPYEEREHFVFVGNFFHQPNVDAVLQLKQIWKYIREQLPKAELHIYGAYVNQQIQQLHNAKEGFIIKGYAKNAIEVVKNAKLVIAPIRFGAGIKGKLTEAMLCGTPSVTTLIGAEGMHDDLPWNGVIEDDFEQFAVKAVELYNNKPQWNKAQQNGVNIINQIYNKETLEKVFIDTINQTSKNLKLLRQQNFIGSLLQHQSMQATKFMSKWIEEKNKM